MLHKMTYKLHLNGELETKRLAKSLSPFLNTNNLVILSGDLGTGKTTFARSLIRFLAGKPELTITSPTYLILQEYDGISTKLVHADLYRLANPDELYDIGFNETCDNAITILEWPERCPEVFEYATLAIRFNMDDASNEFSRTVSITADRDLLSSIITEYHITTFLSASNWIGASRELIAGDASGRRYERLTIEPNSAVLMIVPPAKPEPIVRDNRTYKNIAKLSNSLDTFVAVTNGLISLGFSAPEILNYDLERGLILTEDLGTEHIYNTAGPILDRYLEAVRFLGKLHKLNPTQKIPNTDGSYYQLPKYDEEALLIETELFIDWYIPNFTVHYISAKERENFLTIWKGLLEPLQNEPHSWTLRDFHSPNILWLQERAEASKIGLIDIQDTVWGHPAYDLASLLQDARVEISEDMELELYALYVRIISEHNAGFDVSAFSKSYAIYALQRVTKILGIFVRLKLRDNKPEYIQYLPQLIRYLRRNISHPALFEYNDWLKLNCPSIFNSSIDTGQLS